jgi:peptide/nickel transport system substrate-binding protein
MRIWRSNPASPSRLEEFETLARSLRGSGRALFYFFSILLICSVIGLLYILNSSFLVAVPAHGGSWSEGIIGAPRFINPVLAVSQADQDVTALVFSGLLKATPDGEYIPDLAQSYDVSADGKTYTVTLRPNAQFQDGKPVTADDIIFTIDKVQDPAIQSPEAANWRGVVVQKIDAHTVSFTLGSAYAPFIENLTLGILPQHVWGGVSSADFAGNPLNTNPIGSGPFSIANVSRTAAGVPSAYTLKSFSRSTLGQPYLDTVTLRFYQNGDDLTDALKSGDVHAASGFSPANLSELKNASLDTAPLNRIFGVFFNQNQSAVLRDSAVREALNDSIDRNALIKNVLGGYGDPLTGPLPPSVLGAVPQPAKIDLAAVKTALANAGWQPGPSGTLQKTTGSGKKAQTQTLAFTLATGNVPELRAAAEYLRTTWDSLGADVTVNVYEQGDLTQNVIRPRTYDALLFGMVVGREPDLYAFWDSSQRLDPGLNVAEYANATVDKIVESLRTTTDSAQQKAYYSQFSQALSADTPAAFLYAPDFVYIVENGTKGIDLGSIESPSDRFLSIANWYQQSDEVWPFLVRFSSRPH